MEVFQLLVVAGEENENVARPSVSELGAALPDDLPGLSDDELLTAAADARRLASWAQSRELAAIAELRRRRVQDDEGNDPGHRILDAHESVCQEVSAALTVTGNAASTLVHLAERLTTTLPGTRRALESGRIDLPKARVLCDLTDGLDPELCQHLEATVLPTADQRTTGQLRRRIRTLIQRMAPEHLQQRKREAVRDRRLEIWDDEHSATSNLVVTGLDPLQAHTTFNRITAAARAMRADGDPRTLHQLRADLARQLLRGHPLPDAIRLAVASGGREARAVPDAEWSMEDGSPRTVAVPEPSADDAASDALAALVAELTDRELTGLRDHLKATGRALPFRITRVVQELHDRLANLRDSWCRTHDPAHGRTVYRPSTSLRRAVEARYVTCAFPTCNQRSSRCDLDHTIPWGRGKSCQCNLAPLCRKHHRTKQTPGWRLLQPWPGLLIWITPSGRWHITLPTRE
jgi:hypothetical protein